MMLKKIATVLLLFPSYLLADSGVYSIEDGKLDIRDGSYLCYLYPAYIFREAKIPKEFPRGYFPKIMMKVRADGNGKYLGVSLYPNMPSGAKPEGSWGYFGVNMALDSRNNKEVIYDSVKDNINFSYLVGTKQSGVVATLSSNDPFSPVNAVLGRCKRVSS
ncbi:hypothetical protein [Xenorhabdus innexi]|uniref:Uncharacterized protein n=1 Tax=Xenorhabdus innexi TaxID=290109 RepID=A0A1N6MZ41_9GAMM|nr:hypothetical protein [Xenorhabdus innexi]PHM33432.1 hypothetical protein Xinn_02420 [Xenorhabdus innexi]SIP74090.1 exported hypothetical protein [Xenorhabdus innexi]